MDTTLATILATVIASVLIIGAMAYWQGRADERRARRVRGIRYAQGLLTKKARREHKERLVRENR